nr:CD99 antigen-like [Pogona vitticeps]
MRGLAVFVALALALLATHCRGQDFDLSEALDPASPTTKPTTPDKKQPAPPARNPADDGFNLEDAFNGDEPKKPAPPPAPQPQPGSHDDSGGFSDKDLYEGQLPTPKPEPASQGMLAGIISSVVVAIAGAVSSFIAYQKKKLCFKAGDQENVNMESQQGAHAEPPVQRTLLQKS